MKVVMIGGTGFLGYFTTAELVGRGHEAVAVGLEQPAPGSMSETVQSVAVNTDTASDGELLELLDSVDVLIHAAGADGRNMYDAPALEEFRRANVGPMQRLLPLMKLAGVKKLVIFGSYYTALHRLFPHLGIVPRNAYPRSRDEQAELAFSLAGDDISVIVLELPYIFGGAPGRGTLWGFYLDYLRDHSPEVSVPAGGSACVTARQVAVAAVGACERVNGHRHFPIGGVNLDYVDIYKLFADALQIERRFVIRDDREARAKALLQKTRLEKAGKETGYDPLELVRLQAERLFLDPLPAMEALDYGADDLAAAVRETVAATLAFGGRGPASLSQHTADHPG